jgi:D-glycero-D-manno-heptose 1,7-bisphosphate phosphatase
MGPSHTAQRALFLDRDGTLCELVPYLSDPDGVRLVRGAASALARAKAAGYRLVVVTNQSGIARGLFTRADVEAVHAEVSRQLARHGLALDGYYVCPHHPDHSGACDCRKPQPGLIRRAARDLGIDCRRSFVIGDTIEDAQAGAAAGCAAVLVRTGYGAEQERTRAAQLPAGTLVADDLGAAVAAILAGPGG